MIFKLPRNLDCWMNGYLGQVLGPREQPDPSKPVDILFCICDHFEPRWNNVTLEVERKRVDLWMQKRPGLAHEHRDADGFPPQHSFFYPEEEYREEHLEKLAELCHAGHGEVEIHLHHDKDTSRGLRAKIERFKEQLRAHGLLARTASGDVRYAFIHGNWALDNSLPDGSRCGVNDELVILRETGCYADFTLPSAPSAAQTRTVNAIYYATDDIEKPKSHDAGIEVESGREPSGDLMMIQGPLTLDWARRKWGLLPRIENGEVAGYNLPTPERVRLWINQGIHVKGRPNWIFVKVYTHGTQEENEDALLGRPMHQMLTFLEENYNDGSRYRLHYVTAREMYNVVKAAEAGFEGDPNLHRDRVLVLDKTSRSDKVNHA